MTQNSTARILVIDAERDAVDTLVACLHEEGYNVLGALTPEEGLKLFILSRPDLVLLDILLPGGMNGIDVLKRIYAINPTARVVMVSGNTEPEVARAALELGALAYVDKPFDVAYLKRVVAMALETGTKQLDAHARAERRAGPSRESW